MKPLNVLNKLRASIRVPIKALLLAIVVFGVCFPFPSRFVRHIRHWSDPNALVDPNAASLQPLLIELESLVPPGAAPKDALRTIEAFVYKKVPYDWDWNTWGLADYLPTVDEVMSKGREDCDGRAVVAASLLAASGYEAEIVTDFSHVWVKTNHGEVMGPGGKKAIVATPDGLKVSRGALRQVPRALAYGISVFPRWREIIVLAAAFLLLVGPRSRWQMSLALFIVAALGLELLRRGGIDWREPVVWKQLLGAALMSACALTMFALHYRDRARSGAETVSNDPNTPAPSSE